MVVADTDQRRNLTGVITTVLEIEPVELDFDRGTAHKTYKPPLWVCLLYWIVFQAPFPYVANHAALEASRYRRQIVGFLTKFWYGEDFVAPVLDIHDESDGSHGFVTQLVRGPAPQDKKHARKFMKGLTRNFLDAGLPTWQVTPYNPRAVGNLIQQDDGTYCIIDLESNLVAPLVPLSRLVGAIREGAFPAFDDIDTVRLDDYIEAHSEEITAALGTEDTALLRSAAVSYGEASREWHDDEPRIFSRLLRFALRLVDVPRWIRALQRGANTGQAKAEAFLENGIEQWASEGLLSETETENLQQARCSPEVGSGMANLGAHLLISVQMWGPPGSRSLSRFLWTVSMRLKAEWGAVRHQKPAGGARQLHTVLVALFALIPLFGGGAYFLSKPMRSNRALSLVLFDRFLRKLPFRAYQRLHLSALTIWYAYPRQNAGGRSEQFSFKGLLVHARSRLGALSPMRLLMATVLAVNVIALTIASILYFGCDTEAGFSEKGLVNTTDVIQLVIAGGAGIAVFFSFWRFRAGQAGRGEAAGSFFWGLAGLGLLAFALDDYLTFHENAGLWLERHVGTLPLMTNSTDDLIVMSYALVGLVALYLFRHEVTARRNSSTLLILGVIAAVVMVGTDAYAHARIIKALELPAQAFAGGLLMLAMVVRLSEVRSPVVIPSWIPGVATAKADCGAPAAGIDARALRRAEAGLVPFAKSGEWK